MKYTEIINTLIRMLKLVWELKGEMLSSALIYAKEFPSSTFKKLFIFSILVYQHIFSIGV